MNSALPFVGRVREIALLRRLHAQRKHVLILGAEGVGKSALVAHLRKSLRLRVCPASERLSEICEALERELGLEAGELRLIQRKNRVLNSLKGTKRAVVFDGASWTTPKLASFIQNVSERVPVWLCVRSEHPWDIGRIWPLLVRFEKIELRPFHFSETNALLIAAVESGQIPPLVNPFAQQLHRLSTGLPLILCELLEQFGAGHYDLSHRASLQLLELDRRIRHLPPSLA